VNDVTKVFRDSPGGGGYRVGKQAGGTVPLSKLPLLEAVAIEEIADDTGNVR